MGLVIKNSMLLRGAKEAYGYRKPVSELRCLESEDLGYTRQRRARARKWTCVLTVILIVALVVLWRVAR